MRFQYNIILNDIRLIFIVAAIVVYVNYEALALPPIRDSSIRVVAKSKDISRDIRLPRFAHKTQSKFTILETIALLVTS